MPFRADACLSVLLHAFPCCCMPFRAAAMRDSIIALFFARFDSWNVNIGMRLF
jgi:hypothetical protein